MAKSEKKTRERKVPSLALSLVPLIGLIFFPGVPGFFFLLGLLLGWRLWKKWWAPRVIDDPGP